MSIYRKLIEEDFSNLKNGIAVCVQSWSTPQLDAAIRYLICEKNDLASTSTDKAIYGNFCRDLFHAWSIAPDAKKSVGLSTIDFKAGVSMSFEKVVLDTITNNDCIALQHALKYVEPTYNQSLFLRQAVQEQSMAALRLLLPISPISDVAHLGVETACRKANETLLDLFLPYTDPTNLDYYLIRYAAHRCKENAPGHQIRCEILQRIIEWADVLSSNRGEDVISKNPSRVPLKDARAQTFLNQAARDASFRWDLQTVVAQQLEQNAISHPRSRKM